MDRGALDAAGARALRAAGAGGRLAARSVHPARRRRPLRRGAPAAAPGGLDREKLRPDPAPAPAAHAGVAGADSHPAGAARGRRGSTPPPPRQRSHADGRESRGEEGAGGQDPDAAGEGLPGRAHRARLHARRSSCWSRRSCPRSAPTSASTGHRRALPALPAAPRTGRRFRCRCSSARSTPPASSGPRPGRSTGWPARWSSATAVRCRGPSRSWWRCPGVGRKTANVVLGNAFGIPALAVDTHVFRVSQRLGLARGDDAEKIHDQLCQVLPRPTLDAGQPPAHPPRPARLRRPQAGLPDLPDPGALPVVGQDEGGARQARSPTPGRPGAARRAG